MLLAKIKGNKVYFGKLVTFLGEGGNLPPTYPLDPMSQIYAKGPCKSYLGRSSG